MIQMLCSVEKQIKEIYLFGPDRVSSVIRQETKGLQRIITSTLKVFS